MAAWVCLNCTTVYHVDAPACPYCGADDHYEQGAEMPKNTRLSGMSHAAAGIGPDPIDDVPGDQAVIDAQEPAGDVDVDDTADTATDTDEATSGAEEAPGEPLERPGVTATREAWAAYAQKAHGIDPTGMTRNALIDAVIDAEAVNE